MALNAKRIFAVSVAFAGAFAIGADADVIKMVAVADGNVESVKIVGSTLPLGGPNYTGGVYTGLYTAKNLTTGETWLTYCIDPIGEINTGSTWNANLLDGGELASGQGVLYTDAYGTPVLGITDAIGKQKYAMISYLAETYYYDLTATNPMANTNTSTEAKGKRSDLSLAFWEISRDFDGTAASLNLDVGKFYTTAGVDTYASSLIADAYSHRNDQITMAVWSPTERPSQEFLTFKVPEASTFSLLLLGMSCMAGFVGMRRKK